MTKKSKSKLYVSSVKTIKIDQHSIRNTPTTIPVNLQEQKEKFLKHGKTPSFIHNTNSAHLQEFTSSVKGQIRFDYLGEAKHILQLIKDKYGNGDNYLLECYGKRISQEESQDILTKYLEENLLNESLTVIWCKNLGCSAKMMWTGPTVKTNRPEARRYTLWLNNSDENPYIREHGLKCLLDHEIGTHFFRMFNDGLQPWYSDRKRFGLRSMGSFDSLCYEEGLATIHSILGLKARYLWLSALVYYTACKSTEMNFKQLFDHLAQFITNREQRWKHVMRVKRGLADPNDLGGYGKDQCYFEGALKILRNVEDIDFTVLMSGKLCADEVSRIKRVVRKDCIKLPAFMKNPEKYKKKLRLMAVLNGLHLEHPQHQPSLTYLTRLHQRRNKVGALDSITIHKVRKKSKSHNVSRSRTRKSASDSSISSPSESNILLNLTSTLSSDIVTVIPNSISQPIVKDEESISVSAPPIQAIKESCEMGRVSPVEIESMAKYKTTKKINPLTVSTDTIQTWRQKNVRCKSARSKNSVPVRPTSAKCLSVQNTSVSEIKLKNIPNPPSHKDKYFGCLNQNPVVPKEPIYANISNVVFRKIKDRKKNDYDDDQIGKVTITHLQQEMPLSMFGGLSHRHFFQQQSSKLNP